MAILPIEAQNPTSCQGPPSDGRKQPTLNLSPVGCRFKAPVSRVAASQAPRDSLQETPSVRRDAVLSKGFVAATAATGERRFAEAPGADNRRSASGIGVGVGSTMGRSASCVD